MKKGIEITLKIVNVLAVLNTDVDGANDGKYFPSENANTVRDNEPNGDDTADDEETLLEEGWCCSSLMNGDSGIFWGDLNATASLKCRISHTSTEILILNAPWLMF